MRAPLVSFSHLIYPRSNLSLSPRGALGFGDGDRRSWIPEVSSPPLPSPLSPSSSPSPSSPLRARPYSPRAWPPAPARRPSASAPPAPAPSPATAWARLPLLLPRGGAARPCSLPRGGVAPPLLLPRGGATSPVLPHGGPGPGDGPLRAASGALRAVSAPVRGVPAPSGAAPWPPRVRPLGPLRATVLAPVGGPCPRQRGPRRGSRGLGAASRSPVYPNAFPRAQPHARGDLFLVFN